jgi:tetratricopeptide (TPR) repeat protein
MLDLGDLECREGNEGVGIPLLEQAVEVAERELPENDPYTALGLRMLGEGYLSAGRVPEARAILERRLAWDLKFKPAGHPDIGWTMGLLAGTVPDSTRRRELYEGAAHNWLAAYGPDHPRGAHGLLLLADYRFADGDRPGAIALCDSALAVLVRTRGLENADVAWAEQTEGEMYAACGRNDEASRCFERSVATFTRAAGPTATYTGMGLRDLSEALIGAGRPEQALEAALRAEAIHRQLLSDNARSMPEAQALTLPTSPFLSSATGLDVLLSLASGPLAGDATVRRAAWDALVRSRAVVQEAMLERHHRWIGERDPELVALAARFDSAAWRVSKLVVRGPAPDQVAEFRSRLEQARAARDRAERELAEHSARLRSVEACERRGLDSLVAMLPAGCALAAYAEFNRTERRGSVLTHTPSYVAFVLGHDGVPAVVSLGPARSVDSLVARWRRELRGTPWTSTGEPAAERHYRSIAGELRRAVWDPVAIHAHGARRLFVVPDGSLALVNFSTLPEGDSGYVLEHGPCLHYLPTERDLALGLEPAHAGRGLLAMGAPAFDSSAIHADAGGGLLAAESFRGPHTDCVSFREIRFGALPASRGELATIAGIWRASHPETQAPTSVTRSPVEIRVGADASEASFRAEAPGRSVLHLATHGFFVGGECLQPEVAARGIGGLISSPVAAAAPEPGADPLQLSGLALAGANLRGSAAPDQDDGILTAEEIASMDLDGVQWAVLSACDTGLGDYRASEGVMGFRRAFLIAGARTTIMSLWEVRDESVARWMQTLYTGHWQRGLDTADAVREASIAELRRLRAAGLSTHPARWGAFIAVGDWR